MHKKDQLNIIRKAIEDANLKKEALELAKKQRVNMFIKTVVDFKDCFEIIDEVKS